MGQRGQRLGQIRIRLCGPGFHQLDGDHRATSTNVADPIVIGLHPMELVLHQLLDLLGTCEHSVEFDGLDGRQRGGARQRVASVGPAQSADMRRIHDLGLAGYRRQWQTVGDALGRHDQIGLDTFVLTGEHRPGAGETALHLIGDEDHVVFGAPGAQRGKESRCRHDESAFALDGFDDDGRQVGRADLLVDHRQRPLGGELPVGAPFLVDQAVPVGVGHRRAVDLRRERAETALVGHRLGGQAHREVGPSVVRVVERHHRAASGVGACDLDGVLDCLSAGVEQRGALLARPRGESVEVLGDGDVLLVGSDHEAGVGEVGYLFANRVHHSGRGVADRGDCDTRAQVDEPVAVDVLDDAAGRAGHEHRHGDAHATGDRSDPALAQFGGDRSGDRGDEFAALFDGAEFHGAHSCSPDFLSSCERSRPTPRRNRNPGVATPSVTDQTVDPAPPTPALSTPGPSTRSTVAKDATG